MYKRLKTATYFSFIQGYSHKYDDEPEELLCMQPIKHFTTTLTKFQVT